MVEQSRLSVPIRNSTESSPNIKSKHDLASASTINRTRGGHGMVLVKEVDSGVCGNVTVGRFSMSIGISGLSPSRAILSGQS